MRTACWLLLVVVSADVGCAAEADQRDRLDTTARSAIRAVPLPWRVVKSQKIDAAQTRAIGARLGARVDSLSNAVLAALGGNVQVNTLVCPTAGDAKKIAAKFREIHKGNDRVLLDGRTVVELVGPSDELCRRAAYELGLRPMPETFRWHVAFDAAPVETCHDPMAWNRFYNAMLRFQSGDAGAEREIAELSRSFAFGRELTLGREGTDFEMMPAAQKSERIGAGQVRYVFGELPRTAGVPTVHVEGTVTIGPPASAVESPGPALTAATEFWPVEDAEIAALAKRITKGRTGAEDRAAVILAWLAPGANLRYAGPAGSRHGVKACLKGREGRCWDFSDVFVTLCRASGIPARQTYGWLYGADGHVWAEVWLPNRGWVQVDPTGGGKLECNPFHIAWAFSEDGELPLVYVSKPEITLAQP